MKHLLMACAALVALAASTFGQVQDGSEWVSPDGNTTVTVNVTQDSTMNSATVSFKDDLGTSGNVNGTLGPGSSQSNPNVSDSGEGWTSDGNGNSNTYRVKNGKVESKNEAGQWVKWKEKKKDSTRPGSGDVHYL